MTHPEQNPYFVFHNFERSQTGDETDGLTLWPRRLTLTPQFTLGRASEAQTLEVIESVANTASPFTLMRGEEVMYGPNNDIPATTLHDAGAGERLKRLHANLIYLLGAAGCEFADLQYAFNNYSPHSSHGINESAPFESLYVARSISLGVKRADQPKPNKSIVATFDL